MVSPCVQHVLLHFNELQSSATNFADSHRVGSSGCVETCPASHSVSPLSRSSHSSQVHSTQKQSNCSPATMRLTGYCTPVANALIAAAEGINTLRRHRVQHQRHSGRKVRLVSVTAHLISAGETIRMQTRLRRRVSRRTCSSCRWIGCC